MNTITKHLSLLLILACSLGSAQNKEFETAQFESAMDSLRMAYKIPGMSIGVSINDSIVISRGFGYADLKKKRVVTGDTPFRIASLTKPIFTTVFFHLMENNLVDLEWKMRNHVPDYERDCQRILAYLKKKEPEYTFFLENYQYQRDDILVKHHLSHTAENTPGTAYKYNGFLFGMLSKVVYSATDQSFDQWVNQLVIDKLDLKHSAASQLDKSKKDVLKDLALPYRIDEKGNAKRGEFPNKQLNAGAGLVFSAHDLLLFDKAFNTNQIVTQASKERMLDPYVLADQSTSPYGYGWFIQKYKGYTLVWHYGLQPDAYSSIYLKILEKNVTFVALANSDTMSKPFNLKEGDVLSSVFAREFLDQFLSE